MNTSRDIFVCASYIGPPKISSIYINKDETPFQVLESQLLTYFNLGDIIPCGDFNARTGNLKDFLENDDVQDLCINSCFNMAEELQVRNNRDIQISPFGRLLIETCISFNLAILNGRTRGDLSDQYTWYTHNGASTIDYAIVDKTLIQHIDHFTVHPPSFNSCIHVIRHYLWFLNCHVIF